MATAQVYIKRFYTKVEIRRTNPFLVITTALYLACKMEETPQHIRLVNQEARSLWTGGPSPAPPPPTTPFFPFLPFTWELYSEPYPHVTLD